MGGASAGVALAVHASDGGGHCTHKWVLPVERVTDETGGDHVPISGDKTNNNSNNNGPFDGFLLKGMSTRPGRKGADIVPPVPQSRLA